MTNCHLILRQPRPRQEAKALAGYAPGLGRVGAGQVNKTSFGTVYHRRHRLSFKVARDVGWEVRRVSFHFDWFGANAYPCMQIRGGVYSLYTYPTNSCAV